MDTEIYGQNNPVWKVIIQLMVHTKLVADKGKGTVEVYIDAGRKDDGDLAIRIKKMERKMT